MLAALLGLAFAADLNGTPVKPKPTPEFEAQAHDGSKRTLADLKGKPTALWFYPMADTPG